MASLIWNRDPQEAIKNPYEYNVQKQFHREALAFSDLVAKRLFEFKYTLNDVSLEKATWMLQTDSLFAFRDSVLLLENKKHRVVGRLLRDILETVHLTEFLNSKTKEAEIALEKWFKDELIMHSEFRKFIKNRDGEESSELKKYQHRIFSKFTHRSYKTLLYGYSLRNNDEISYDERWTLPQSIAMYYAYLGHFGQFIKTNLSNYGSLNSKEIDNIWSVSMEKEQIPMGYLSKEDKEFLQIKNE